MRGWYEGLNTAGLAWRTTTHFRRNSRPCSATGRCSGWCSTAWPARWSSASIMALIIDKPFVRPRRLPYLHPAVGSSGRHRPRRYGNSALHPDWGIVSQRAPQHRRDRQAHQLLLDRLSAAGRSSWSHLESAFIFLAVLWPASGAIRARIDEPLHRWRDAVAAADLHQAALLSFPVLWAAGTSLAAWTLRSSSTSSSSPTKRRGDEILSMTI